MGLDNIQNSTLNLIQGKIQYKVSYRDIKYPRLEFTTGELLLILPFGYKYDTLFEKHKVWIEKKISFIMGCLKEATEQKLINRTNKEFKNIILSYVKKISKELDVKVKVRDIYFRRMKTKWASLSSKRNLTINTLMKYLPEHLIKYVILHEMAHLIEKRHGDRFWSLVSRKYKDYPEKEKEMFVYWFLVIKNY